MRFSLILATINRSKEITYCVESFRNQVFKDFEIIVVDQSDDEKTKESISLFSDLNIKYKHVDFKGLSRARNYALTFVNGDYFCLIDDDAVYDKNYLSNINNLLRNKNDLIVSGYIYDLLTETDFCNYKDINNPKNLSTREIFRYCPSAGLTIPSCLIENKDFFDEKFGVGSTYSSGEETDCLLRLNKKGITVVFEQQAKLKHPCGDCINSASSSAKLLKYVEGQGALFSKKINIEKDYRVIPYFIERFMKLSAKKIISSFKFENNKELSNFLKGYFKYKKGMCKK